MFGRKPKPQPTTSQADAAQLAALMANTNAMIAQFNSNASR